MVKSTRSNLKIASYKAIIEGLASDGGLYIFDKFPPLDLKELMKLNYQELSKYVLHLLLDDYTTEEINYVIDNAYDNKFDTKDIVGFKHFDFYSILELFHGPTLAFKDMALTVLPNLLKIANKKENITGDTIILTATSGDTGGATLSGFKNIETMKTIVFYPNDGVSPIQEKQMLSFSDKDSRVIALEGNFDDAQDFVKNAFRKYPKLSSSNSINLGRLAPQVIYYVYSYLELVRMKKIKLFEEINVCVPTGNFGNILASYIAKLMGLPIKNFICASNENNVLTDFFNTGIYNKKREFFKTNSPSMDILISSNLERLIYLLSDEKTTEKLMNELNENGIYEVPNEVKKKLADFYGFYADHNETITAIKTMFYKNNYLIDPHTAVAYKCYNDYKEKYDDPTFTLIVSTASPYKFSDTICDALDIKENILEKQLIKINEMTKLPIPKAISSYNEGKKTVWLKDEKDLKFKELLKELGYDNN